MGILRASPEILVNSTTADNQTESNIATLPDGRFVTSWNDRSSGFDNTNIRVRILNADGSEAVSENVVNNTLPGNQEENNIVALPDGRFLVIWTDEGQDGSLSGADVMARIFDVNGTQSVPEFRANSTFFSDQRAESVAVLPNGRIVIIWKDFIRADLSDDIDLRARIFDSSGVGSPSEFLVNSAIRGSQDESSIAVLSDGRFVVTWTDESNISGSGDTDFSAVRARIFNVNGTQSVPEFLVNSTTIRQQSESQIAVLADGRFVISWTDGSAGIGDNNIRARIFNTDGAQSLQEFVVNTTTLGQQSDSNVAVLADGRIVFTWVDMSTGFVNSNIHARILNPDGTQSIPEFVVNATTQSLQYNSSLAIMADGRFVVSWTDESETGGDTSGTAIRSQVFDPTVFDGTIAGDSVTGGSFDDRYNGYNGNDSLSGRGGDDRLNGGDGNDTLRGEDGNDTLDGGNNFDNLDGGIGDDMLYGRAGIDTLTGGDGGDNFWGGTSADQHIGGSGVDFARYDDAHHGNLTIRLDTQNLNTGAAIGDSYSSIEGLVGGLGNDTIFGNSSNNFLFGTFGNDVIHGLSGVDLLDGGFGSDRLFGGVGADQHIGGEGVDFAHYDDANHGDLTIRLDAENLNIGVALGDTYDSIEGLVGGLGNDVVIGNALANTLLGGGGLDFIDGQGGSDTLTGGADADRFRFSTALGTFNIDRVTDFTVAVDDLLLLRSIFTAIGSSLNAEEFRIGAGAADANDFIVYNPLNGALKYDSDGNGAGVAVQFATLSTGLALAHTDFVMV